MELVGAGKMKASILQDSKTIPIYIKRLKELKAALPDMPFVLHGGSGLSDEELARCVKGGINKVSFFTNLMLAVRGDAANQAEVLAKLRSRTALIANFGRDAIGLQIEQLLRNEGVDLSYAIREGRRKFRHLSWEHSA